MNTTLWQELDVWEELDDQENELIVGGAVVREGDNSFKGVPFIDLYTPGQGGLSFPNANGYFQSANALPNAFGAPAVNGPGFS